MSNLELYYNIVTTRANNQTLSLNTVDYNRIVNITLKLLPSKPFKSF